MELFFERIYTVAFRLTGEVETACQMAEGSIITMNEKYNNNFSITEEFFKLTVIELIRIFLNDKINYYDSQNEIQNALLQLNPVNRAVIVWKDVLKFKLSDNIPIENYSLDELRKELSSGRKALINCIIHSKHIVSNKRRAVCNEWRIIKGSIIGFNGKWT